MKNVNSRALLSSAPSTPPPPSGAFSTVLANLANTLSALEDTLGAMHDKLGLGNSNAGSAGGPGEPMRVGLLSDAANLESRLNQVLSTAVFINSAL